MQNKASSEHSHDSQGKLTHQCGEDVWVPWGGWETTVSSVSSDTSTPQTWKCSPLCSFWSRELLTFLKPGHATFHDWGTAIMGRAKPSRCSGTKVDVFPERVGSALLGKHRKHLCSEKKRVQKNIASSLHTPPPCTQLLLHGIGLSSESAVSDSFCFILSSLLQASEH